MPTTVTLHLPEQDHRAIKRIIRLMMGFKDFRCARIILSGIEIAHMIRKELMQNDGATNTAAEQFYSLPVADIRQVGSVSLLSRYYGHWRSP